jgi:hypothetical protein
MGKEAPTPAHERRDVRPEDASSGGWHLQSGLRTLFTYLDMRGMARGLLPTSDAASDDDAHAQAARFAKALQVPPFAHVLPANGAASAHMGERTAFVAACEALDLPPQAVMVVSDSSAVLRAARSAGSFSCYWRKLRPGAARALPSDFLRENCDGIKDVVEELNGVTYRDPDTEIRSKYGVYAT